MKTPRHILDIICLCIVSIVYIHSTSAQFRSKSNSYALVIGISDYQDPLIPDLSFADADAQRFSDFLQSPSGGNIKSEQISLLLNDEATCGNVHQALDQLLEKAKKNDKVYIFFSGHGDVESINEDEQGHLLLPQKCP